LGRALHLCCDPDGTPLAVILAPATRTSARVALRLALALALRGGDSDPLEQGYAGRELATIVAECFGAVVLRPVRAHGPENGLGRFGIRRSVESVCWRLNDRLGVQAQRAQRLIGLCARTPANCSRS
jgi:hypothetical protein